MLFDLSTIYSVLLLPKNVITDSITNSSFQLQARRENQSAKNCAVVVWAAVELSCVMETTPRNKLKQIKWRTWICTVWTTGRDIDLVLQCVLTLAEDCRPVSGLANE